MEALKFLERFDARIAEVEEPKDPTTLPGYEAGFEAGRALAFAERKQIDTSIVDALSELTFGYAEAYQHIMTTQAPFFEVLAKKLLPGLEQQVLAA